jgi:hypothetical protein
LIITHIKPLDEILKYLEPYKKILVLGCDGCTQPPRSLKEAEIFAELIEIAGKLNDKGYQCKTFTISRQCDNNVVATNLPAELEGMEAVLSLACGCGPQTIAEVFPELKIFPGQDTLFMGSDKMEDATYFEKCRGCGDCVLYNTNNICPITRCSKNILNGPCGGTTAEGKCEVDPDTDCAWYLIYKRGKDSGKLPLIFDQINPPRDWRPAGYGGPRRSKRENIDYKTVEAEEQAAKAAAEETEAREVKQ